AVFTTCWRFVILYRPGELLWSGLFCERQRVKTGRRTDPDGPRRVSTERDAALGGSVRGPPCYWSFRGNIQQQRTQ
ncbi:hypothetical protein GBAR_LOCUS1639, partial [Geodia barretti]